MGIIDKLEARKASRQEDMEKRTAEIRKYQGRLAGVESDIEKAIDTADTDKVEKLTVSKRDLENKIEALQIINERNKKYAISRDEVAAEWNKEVLPMQKKIDSAEQELRAITEELACKLITFAEIITEARDKRKKVLSLIDDEEAYTINAGNLDFNYVHFSSALMEHIKNMPEVHEVILKLDPNGFNKINGALISAHNNYFRPKKKREVIPAEDTKTVNGFTVAIPGRS